MTKHSNHKLNIFYT